MVSALARELRRAFRLLRDPHVQRPFATLWAYLKLRVLTRLWPGRRKPIRIVGYTISYAALEPLRWIFEEVFLDRDYFPGPLRDSPRILDAGANIGVATLFFKQQFPLAEVVCFEPDPENFALLERNVEQNRLSGVRLYNVAVASDEGTARLHYNPELPDSRQSTSEAFARTVITGGRLASREVPSVRLETYLEQPVDLLKIDIEAGELDALRGAGDLLPNVSAVRMEYHWSPGNALDDVLRELRHAGHRYSIGKPLDSWPGSVTTIRSERVRTDSPMSASPKSPSRP